MRIIEEWIKNNCVNSNYETYYSDGVKYRFYHMKDGWIAIFRESETGEQLFPSIQASDEERALGYIGLIEQLDFPAEKIEEE